MIQADTLFLIKTSRPQFWLGSTAFFLLGAASVNLTGLSFWLGLLFCTVPAGLIINGINDIADRQSDARNPRKIKAGSLLTDHKVRLILKYAVLCTVTALAVCIVAQQYTAATIMLLLVATWLSYSCRPLRTKSIPILDSFTNGMGMLLFLVLARALQINEFSQLFHFSEVYWLLFFGVVALHALQTLWDIESDTTAGDTTIGTLLKMKGTLLFCLLLFCTLLIFFRSLHIALNLYLVVAVGLSLYMLLSLSRTVIFRSTWILLYGFPVVVVYFLLFEQDFLVKLLQN